MRYAPPLNLVPCRVIAVRAWLHPIQVVLKTHDHAHKAKYRVNFGINVDAIGGLCACPGYSNKLGNATDVVCLDPTYVGFCLH